MSSLGWNVNRISNWWFFCCCCLTSSSIISIRHSQGEWQKLHKWVIIVNSSESIVASFCFVLHISIMYVFVCAHGSQQARHVTGLASQFPTWKLQELNSRNQAWRQAFFCTLSHLTSPWKCSYKSEFNVFFPFADMTDGKHLTFSSHPELMFQL